MRHLNAQVASVLCSSSSLMDGIYGASIHAMVVLDSIRARHAASQTSFAFPPLLPLLPPFPPLSFSLSP